MLKKIKWKFMKMPMKALFKPKILFLKRK